jgi:hypothetical protein
MAIDDHRGSAMPNEHSVTEAPSKDTTGPLPAVVPKVVVRPTPWPPGADDADEAHSRLSPQAASTLFEIAVATMWSDGELITSEVERGRATARVMRLQPRGGGAFGAIAAGALPFTEIDFDALTPTLGDLAYATAAWIAEANSQPSERRTGFLRALAARLGLADGVVDQLREAARAVDRDNDAPEAAFASLRLALAPQTPARLD